MEINIKNYEAFFLDFVEGNLSETEVDKLRAFLTTNPQLKNELESFEQLCIEEINVSNSKLKNQLLREETTGLPLTDYLMIAQVEGNISKTEKAQLAEMVEEDQALLSDIGLYHKTKLSQENQFIFPNKKSLKQQDKKGVFWIRSASMSAAAAILVIVLLNLNSAEKLYYPDSFSYSSEQFNNDATESLASTIVVKENNKTEPSGKFLKLKPAKEKKSILQTNQTSSLKKVKSLAFRSINSSLNSTGKSMVRPEKIDFENLSSHAKTTANNTPISPSNNNQFIPLMELASKKIKTEVLKNKSLKEALLDEVANLSNDKVRIRSEAGKTQRFAINIGKFSYSNF